MLGHRLRRWPNIETALGECPVFAGRSIGTVPVQGVWLEAGQVTQHTGIREHEL